MQVTIFTFFPFHQQERNAELNKTKRKKTAPEAYPSKQTSHHRAHYSSLTCVHLIHTVEEVIWSARDAVAAHTQAAVRALVPGVVGPAESTRVKRSGL